MSSTASEMKMEWNATDELSSDDVRREEYCFMQLKECHPAITQEIWRRRLGLASEKVLEYLFQKNEPPSVSNAFVHYLACMNALRSLAEKLQWAFQDELPEVHAEPYSLAYVDHWCKRTYGDEPAEYDEAKGGDAQEGEGDKARVVPQGIETAEIAEIESLNSYWEHVAMAAGIEEDVEPFAITMPVSRDLSKILAPPEELEALMSRLSDELRGLGVVVLCRVGDVIRPTILFMRIRAGVDTTSPFVQWGFARCWDTLCIATGRAVTENSNLLHALRDTWARELSIPHQTFMSYAEYLKALELANKADEESRLQVPEARKNSGKMARLCAAHHREMGRLADEVSAKLLEGEFSFQEKAEKLVAFVEKGDPAIPISRPSARARLAEISSLHLGEDLVRRIVGPDSEESAPNKGKLIKKFVLEGDDRLPYLTNVFARQNLAESVWPPLAEAKSPTALKSCKVFLARIEKEVKKLRVDKSETEKDEIVSESEE